MEKAEAQPSDPLLPYYTFPPTSPSQSPDSLTLVPSHEVLYLRLLRRRRRNCCPSCLVPFLSTLLSFFLASSLLVFLWPSDPQIQVTHLRLDHLHVSPPPRAAFDLTLRLKIGVQNPDFFALDYRSVVSSVEYRGKHLGSVSAAGGSVKARGKSELEAELKLDGVRVLDEAVYLIEDLAKGSIPLDTVTEVEGTLGLFFFEIPVKGKISCSVSVNPKTQKIIHQDCYPE